MDNNVSKNTFCHKSFKFSSNSSNLAIKNLLKQYIFESIKLYQSNLKLNVEYDLILALIANKIILCSLDKISALDIVYRCAIAFPLAPYWHLSPLTIAQNLREFLPKTNVAYTTKPILEFTVRVVSPGWIDFYLSDRAVAVWLDEVIQWVSQQQKGKETRKQGGRGAEDNGNLFEIQYTYARCCSLLRLGHQEKLIKIKHDYSVWEIVEPIAFSWLDSKGTLLLGNSQEKGLLIQLLTVVENLVTNSTKVNWTKLAQNLSQAFLEFWTECRIYGEVKQKTPELAQARLGLVALVQYFLFRILQDKLSLSPLTDI